jgi:DNA adenine methylase
LPVPKSPFRYPGGKSRLAARIVELLIGQSDRSTSYVEPFVGGGAVALLMAVRYPDIELHLNDMDPRMSSFWTVMSQRDAAAYEKLVRHVEAVVPSVDIWREERRAGFEGSTDDLAFRALFLNRCTFSGNMSLRSGGPIGGYDQTGEWKIDARWKLHLLLPALEALRALLASRSVTVTTGSWENVGAVPGLHYYDPPYTTNDTALYSTSFTVDDHIALRTHLRHLEWPWVLSYDKDRGAHISWMYQFATKEDVQHYSRVQAGANRGIIELLMTPPIARQMTPSS